MSLPSKIKEKLNEYYKNKYRSKEYYITELSKLDGGNFPDLNNTKILGKGSYSTVYEVDDNIAIKVFNIDNNDIYIKTILENIKNTLIDFNKLEKNIKNNTTYISTKNINKEANKFYYYVIKCENDLSKYKNNKSILQEGFNILKELSEINNDIHFIHGDIKLENMMICKNNNVLIHDLDGCFVYDTKTLINISSNPYERDIIVTPFMCNPIFIWYNMTLSQNLIQNDSDLMKYLYENIEQCEKMWNIYLSPLGKNKNKVKDIFKDLYGNTIKDYIKNNINTYFTENNTKEFKLWLLNNLKLCDIYSYYMSLIHNNIQFTNLIDDIKLYIQNRLNIKIIKHSGGKSKSYKNNLLIKNHKNNKSLYIRNKSYILDNSNRINIICIYDEDVKYYLLEKNKKNINLEDKEIILEETKDFLKITFVKSNKIEIYVKR